MYIIFYPAHRQTMHTSITHVALSGGNIRGFMYLGILRYLYAYNLLNNLKEIAGTSFGSAVALIIALRIPLEIVESMFFDYSRNNEMKTISASNTVKAVSALGMDTTAKYTDMLREYLGNEYGNQDMTFIDVAKKTGIQLHMNALCVNTQKEKVFSSYTTPNVPVIHALNASMAIPIITQPVMIDGYLYCDGAGMNNTLVYLFEHIPREHILSIIIDIPAQPIEIPQYSVPDPLTYYSAIALSCFNSMFEQSSKRHIRDDTLVVKDNYPLLNCRVCSEGIVQEFDEDKLQLAIAVGFDIACEYFKQQQQQYRGSSSYINETMHTPVVASHAHQEGI